MPTETLIKMGGKVAVLITAGEYWRLVTPIVLHAGILHCVINIFVQCMFGIQLEREWGASQVALIYCRLPTITYLYAITQRVAIISTRLTLCSHASCIFCGFLLRSRCARLIHATWCSGRRHLWQHLVCSLLSWICFYRMLRFNLWFVWSASRLYSGHVEKHGRSPEEDAHHVAGDFGESTSTCDPSTIFKSFACYLKVILPNRGFRCRRSSSSSSPSALVLTCLRILADFCLAWLSGWDTFPTVSMSLLNFTQLLVIVKKWQHEV